MSTDTLGAPTDRRTFLRNAGVAGVGLAGAGSLAVLLPAAASANGGLTKSDVKILIAAEIAEALAVTTYTNIINTAPFFADLEEDDQGYLEAARQEEMSHYLLEQSLTGKPSPFTTFYYPPKMFSDAQTTLNVLVSLEDAFIAAYLVGVRNFSTPDLRVAAARIMGIESDHRTLARVVGPGVATRTAARSRRSPASRARPRASTRPTTTATSGRWLDADQPGGQRPDCPSPSKKPAQAAGFDTKKPYTFVPFTPTLPEPLGAFTPQFASTPGRVYSRVGSAGVAGWRCADQRSSMRPKRQTASAHDPGQHEQRRR